MYYDKKEITKEDGRYLIFYHFRDTASADQTAAFKSAESFDAKAVSTPDESGALLARAANARTEGQG